MGATAGLRPRGRNPPRVPCWYGIGPAALLGLACLNKLAVHCCGDNLLAFVEAPRLARMLLCFSIIQHLLGKRYGACRHGETALLDGVLFNGVIACLWQTWEEDFDAEQDMLDAEEAARQRLLDVVPIPEIDPGSPYPRDRDPEEPLSPEEAADFERQKQLLEVLKISTSGNVVCITIRTLSCCWVSLQER